MLGFLAAIPVGASQFETARRALAGYLGSAFAVVAGSVSSDLVYGSAAMFGLALFMQRPEVEAVFWLVNAILTMILGIAAIRESREEEEMPRSTATAKPGDTPSRLRNPAIGYVTGFSLAFTNPMMIAWWLLAARFVKDLGITGELTLQTRVLFLVAGGLGIGSYLSLLAITTYRAKKSITRERTKKVTIGFGVAMIVLAIYFTVRAIMVIEG
ncbi:MAG: LysE family transporter [Bacteroidota bacterium]|nr:LysE family transporter [Bacteroidota bacterium]